MSMRSDWQSAKKTAENNFKKAYDNWMKDQEKKAKLGDPKAKKAFAKEILGRAQATFGHQFTSPMTFDADLGPTLDKIEKTHEKAEAALNKFTVDDMIKNKAINNLWQKWAEQVNHTGENYHFLSSGYKLAPDKIYPLYIASGSKYMLNIDASLKDKWDNCAQANDWKTAKTLIKPTFQAIYSLTSKDSLNKFKAHHIMARYLRDSLGGKDMPGLIKKARKACSQYGRQSQAYGKRWKKEKPDFWTPINKALNDILGELDKLEKMYP